MWKRGFYHDFNNTLFFLYIPYTLEHPLQHINVLTEPTPQPRTRGPCPRIPPIIQIAGDILVGRARLWHSLHLWSIFGVLITRILLRKIKEQSRPGVGVQTEIRNALPESRNLPFNNKNI